MNETPRPEPFRRQNRWALDALVRRDFKAKSQFAVELQTVHSTVFDALSGRRDVSEDLLERMAAELGEPVQAISSDPYGLIGPLLALLDSARQLAPHLNGHDFGLRQAIDDVDAVMS